MNLTKISLLSLAVPSRQCRQLRIRRCRNLVGQDRKLATAAKTVTPIEQIVLNSIKATGPISVSSYIQLCLSHPQYGYYMTGDPLGVSGDFITSPEISQVFGELTAVWFLSTFQSNTANATSKRGKTKIRLVELGPGRGTLIADILRVMTGPLASTIGLGLSPISSVHLIETSPSLRSKQEAALSKYSSNHQGRPLGAPIHTPIPITWHDQIDDIHDLTESPEEDIHTFVVANEFFDALPINVFEKSVDGWREVLVDVAPPDLISSSSLLSPLPPSNGSTPSILANVNPTTYAANSHQRLRFVLSATPLPVPFLTSNPRFSSLPIGTRVEYSRSSMDIMRKIGRLIGSDGEQQTTRAEVEKVRANASQERKKWNGSNGTALLVDYGADHFFSNSLRGVRNHKIVDAFDEPGNSDLTSNVDFATLKDALVGISNAHAHGPISQHDFLLRMGLEARLSRLLQNATAGTGAEGDRGKRIKDAALKLIDLGPQGMGRKFQFMAVTNGTVAPYPFSSP